MRGHLREQRRWREHAEREPLDVHRVCVATGQAVVTHRGQADPTLAGHQQVDRRPGRRRPLLGVWQVVDPQRRLPADDGIVGHDAAHRLDVLDHGPWQSSSVDAAMSRDQLTPLGTCQA